MRQIEIFDIGLIDTSLLLPENYKGKTYKNGGLTKHDPRKWTPEEISWTYMLKEKGLSIRQIAECIGRDITQVAIKMKRMSKKNKTYNSKHVDEKYYHNDEFLAIINPESVLDLYSGCPSYYEDKVESLYSNDINPDFATYYSEKAEKLCAKLWYEDYKFDLIDIDPFGSAYECFDLSIKMAKKGLIITFGELGHKRFKRLDFVKRMYGIDCMENFNIEVLIKHIQQMGIKNKKILEPVICKDWGNIGRVYFKVINEKKQYNIKKIL